MNIVSELEKLSADLREMPRHRWDEHLRNLCEQLLLQHARLEPAKIPVKAEGQVPWPRRRR
jgi:hypothetical protein